MNIFQVEESDSLYGFVNDKTGEVIFGLMLPYLDSVMESCDLIISRCKNLNCEKSYKSLEKYEANVCNNLSRVVIATMQLSQTKFKSFEPLVKLLMRIFTSVDNLAKHFLVRIKKDKQAMNLAKFDYLVKHVGKELAPKVYELITFINEVSFNIFT